MKLLFLISFFICSITAFPQKSVQKNMGFKLFSPDTAKYNIVVTEPEGIPTVNIDFGIFNYDDEPAANLYVMTSVHPFMIENAFSFEPYLKTQYDKKKIILRNDTAKFINIQYVNKFNEYYSGNFQHLIKAKTSYGEIRINVTGRFLPKTVQFSNISSWYDVTIGKKISGKWTIANLGNATLNIESIGKVDIAIAGNWPRQLKAGKKLKIKYSYTPVSKGAFTKTAAIRFSREGENKADTAYFVVKGISK